MQFLSGCILKHSGPKFVSIPLGYKEMHKDVLEYASSPDMLEYGGGLLLALENCDVTIIAWPMKCSRSY